MSEEQTQETAVKVHLPAFYGLKAGMTRIFDSNGNHVPVTVIKLLPNYISQVKASEKDGYTAYQLAYYEKREKLVSKPKQGHLKKAGIDSTFARFAEVRVDEVNPEFLGKPVDFDNFPESTYIDVTGFTKGKGFQGVIKRYGFSGGPATHGSKFHRTTGAIGNRATPGRVFALTKMPGHMGNKKRTMQNLKVVELNTNDGYLLIKGSIPGSKNSIVKIQKAIKA
ncbi:MAG: 50S ribosomal protein L3 [Bacteriovoracaceae bacterium]|jgi:large subunit ribosomal protein L3|nr:50S ribosomal protein L3 [Bacteriovoracaceae bacterium]